jgi:hypothetical protein
MELALSKVQAASNSNMATVSNTKLFLKPLMPARLWSFRENSLVESAKHRQI